MKNVFIFIISICFTFTLVSCASTQQAPPSTDSMQSPPSESTDSTQPSSTSPTQIPDATSVTEPPNEVTVVVPSLFFSGIDSGAFDPEQYANDNGFIRVVINEDQSVSITMTEKHQESLLSELAKTIDEWLAQCIESEETPHIKEITHSASFETITISVDPVQYQNATGLTTLSFMIYATMYHSFAGIDAPIEIITIDITNGDILDSQIFQ